MATNFKWAPDTAVTMQDSGSAALASGAAVIGQVSAANAVFDNSSTGDLDFFCDARLVVTFATAPTAGKAIELYLSYELDGSNFADTNNTTPPYNDLVGVFPVQGITTVQHIDIHRAPLSPYKLQAYIRNQTDQQMSAGWTLTLYPAHDQGV